MSGLRDEYIKVRPFLLFPFSLFDQIDFAGHLAALRSLNIIDILPSLRPSKKTASRRQKLAGWRLRATRVSLHLPFASSDAVAPPQTPADGDRHQQEEMISPSGLTGSRGAAGQRGIRESLPVHISLVAEEVVMSCIMLLQHHC